LQARNVTGLGKDRRDCLAICDSVDECVAVDIGSYTSDWDHSQNFCYLLSAGTFSKVPNCHRHESWMSCVRKNSKSDKPALAAPKQSEQKVVETKAVVAKDQVQGNVGTYNLGDYECAQAQYCVDNEDDVLQARNVTGLGKDRRDCLAICDSVDECVAVDIGSYTSDWDHSQNFCYLLSAGTFSKVPNCHRHESWMSCVRKNSRNSSTEHIYPPILI